MNSRRDETYRDNGANSRLKRNQRLSGSFHWSHKKRRHQRGERERQTYRQRKGATTLKFHIKHNQEMMCNYINEFQLNADSEPQQKTLSLSLSLAGASEVLFEILKYLSDSDSDFSYCCSLDNYRFRCQHYNAL